MTIIDREQFIEHFNNISPELGKPNSLLWALEEYLETKCFWFVCVPPVGNKEEYWKWCNSYRKGEIVCFSTSRLDNEEWWGFSNYDDIAFWLLKWA
jgi:hypothetical protein